MVLSTPSADHVETISPEITALAISLSIDPETVIADLSDDEDTDIKPEDVVPFLEEASTEDISRVLSRALNDFLSSSEIIGFPYPEGLCNPFLINEFEFANDGTVFVHIAIQGIDLLSPDAWTVRGYIETYRPQQGARILEDLFTIIKCKLEKMGISYKRVVAVEDECDGSC